MKYIPLHLQSTYTSTDYLYVYRLLIHVQTTYICTDYLYMYRLLIHVRTTYTCTDYLYMYRLLIHVQTTYTCTNYLHMYRALINVHVVYNALIIYLIVSVVALPLFGLAEKFIGERVQGLYLIAVNVLLIAHIIRKCLQT